MPTRFKTRKRTQKLSFVLEFLDVDTTPPKPLRAARVRVQALDAVGKPAATLFDGHANAEGKVVVRLFLPAVLPGQPIMPLPKVHVTVVNLDGNPVYRADIQLERGKNIPPIKVSDAL